MDRSNLELLTQQILERLFVPVEASGRHVHMTTEQAQRLFGHGLTPERPLSQPGQFLSRERVTVVGPKGRFENVAVLGPERKEAQVEISLTDGRTLGLQPPIKLSGRTDGTPGATLQGPKGTVELDRGVLVAQRHIHLTPADGERFQVKDGQMVRLRVFSRRPVIFEDVIVRISPDFQSAAHLDFDEANACGYEKGDFGRIEPCAGPC
jgi:propanediol utilization protein